MATKTTIESATQFLKAIEIAERIIAGSTVVDDKMKAAHLENVERAGKMIAEAIEKGRLNAADLKMLISDFLVYWNEALNEDVELFWRELRSQNIPFERKETLKFVLQKGRFPNVHQALEVRRNWHKLKNKGFLNERFTPEEMSDIEDAIKLDEELRVVFLRMRINDDKIKKTAYLRFTESLAYLSALHLFEKYFTPGERERLEQLWKSS